MLVISTTSRSTIVRLPTPARAKNSAANDPTPPTPTTISCAFFKLFYPSGLNNNSALSCHFAIVHLYFKVAKITKIKMTSLISSINLFYENF